MLTVKQRVYPCGCKGDWYWTITRKDGIWQRGGYETEAKARTAGVDKINARYL